ncbi:PREDICTED: proteoglycan 3 [Miniopterus natalensis]|uniref:proteoglycan 3 n=1 Tax=Miniopterus natalensis TaxID=291302 RepID=UPI0007A6AA3F|nr:PREDICTED: proteoglycan 3 [Miniopterus natalensis]
MKHSLLLPFLLLGTVAALHLGKHAPHLDSQETQADLSQDLEGSGEQEGESFLPEEEIQSEEEQMEESLCQNALEDEKIMESDPSALDKNFQCPRAEDTVEVLGSPGCKTCRYVLVNSPRVFWSANIVCRWCYRGNLVSIHNAHINSQLQVLASRINRPQVWTGGFLGRCGRKLRWTDGSCINFKNWARGHPWAGRGRCVTLCTRGGKWRRRPCRKRLPFICSA